MGASRGIVPGPFALQPLPDLLVASAAGLASGSACREGLALRQPPAHSAAQHEHNRRYIFEASFVWLTGQAR